jgi:hypothetical protein
MDRGRKYVLRDKQQRRDDVCNVAEADGSTVEAAARTAQGDGSRQRRKLELLLAVHTLPRIFARSPQHRYSLCQRQKRERVQTIALLGGIYSVFIVTTHEPAVRWSSYSSSSSRSSSESP